MQALSKNGKIFGTDIMVGVQPCIDKVSNIVLFQNLFICALCSLLLNLLLLIHFLQQFLIKIWVQCDRSLLHTMHHNLAMKLAVLSTIIVLN